MSSPTSLIGAIMLTSVFAVPRPAARAAPPALATPSAGTLRLGLEKLATVGSVLYVAAHPDDENTRLLGYLAGDRKVRVAYASLTRGDGGQNLVGAELGPLLGLVRTYELLAARGVDGAEQLFSRAVDFGYSKSAEETLRVWGKDAILSDLVRIIRTFRPDVIVTRFDTNPPNHGHHTASAILAREAFAAAADPARDPDGPPPYQARVLLENKSHWRFKEGQDLSGYLAVDTGTYSPLLGRSFPEVAAESRTMHKSQGFGTAPTYGPALEYFEVTAVAPGVAAPTADPFAAVATSWARYPGTEALQADLAAALAGFDADHPERSLPLLAKIRAELAQLPADNPARAPKLAEVDALLIGAAGLVVDPRAPAPAVVPGVKAALTATVVARAADGIVLHGVTWPDGAHDDGPGALARGALTTLEHALTLAPTAAFSTPFWLVNPPEPASPGGPPGRFVVADRDLAIRPEGPPDLSVAFDLEIAGARLAVVRPLRHGEVDRVDGERLRPVEVLPPVTVTPAAHVLMLPNGAARPLRVRVMAHADGQSGVVSIGAPDGYRIAPKSAPFSLAKAGDAVELTFTVTPPRGAAQDGTLEALAQTAGGVGVSAALRRDAVDHPHIPARTVLSAARVRAVPFVLKTGKRRVGYIPGAGDEVAESLRQVGYDVTVLDAEALATGDLGRYDAIVAGIRAYNVDPSLGDRHPRLMDYVARGGTYLVQYITSTRRRPLGDVPIGPFPFVIDHDRVTDESAEMTAVDPKARALTTPNAIGPEDFAGWVQERGLYFAREWDPHYAPLLSAHDPDEAPLTGATLVARHGKGAFVYTGLAFFRQLPAGVPGAYRLLANLLALGGGR